ncbi:hypothetical protein V8E53_003967 [Lactarius tabidus]
MFVATEANHTDSATWACAGTKNLGFILPGGQAGCCDLVVGNASDGSSSKTPHGAETGSERVGVWVVPVNRKWRLPSCEADQGGRSGYGQRRTAGHRQCVAQGERSMADGRWQMADSRWQMADGRWQMATANGRWQQRMADGSSEWQKAVAMADGRRVRRERRSEGEGGKTISLGVDLRSKDGNELILDHFEVETLVAREGIEPFVPDTGLV